MSFILTNYSLLSSWNKSMKYSHIFNLIPNWPNPTTTKKKIISIDTFSKCWEKVSQRNALLHWFLQCIAFLRYNESMPSSWWLSLVISLFIFCCCQAQEYQRWGPCWRAYNCRITYPSPTCSSSSWVSFVHWQLGAQFSWEKWWEFLPLHMRLQNYLCYLL